MVLYSDHPPPRVPPHRQGAGDLWPVLTTMPQWGTSALAAAYDMKWEDVVSEADRKRAECWSTTSSPSELKGEGPRGRG